MDEAGTLVAMASHDRARWRRSIIVAGVAPVLAALLLAACTPVAGPEGSSSTTAPAATATSSTVTPGGSNAGTAEIRGQLAALTIVDGPKPGQPYRRTDWPTWLDPDGDGCDARQQALIAQSTSPAQVGTNCKVMSGHWVSPYDGVETTAPGDLDADHLVPLENVHESGGWQWDAAMRRAYANDPEVLIMVTKHANRSKGAKSPADYRPPLESYWCTYASRWVGLKTTWRLSATTRERDTLGQMLDTCAA